MLSLKSNDCSREEETNMRKKTMALLTLVLLVSFNLAISAQAAEKYKGYTRGEVFITAQELNQMMEAKDPKLVVIAVASKTEYYSGHIPGILSPLAPRL